MRVLFSHLIALAFLAAFTTCGFSTHGLNYALAQSNEDTEGRPKPNPTGNPRISCSNGCTVVACGTCNSCADNPCSSGRVCEKCEGHLCCCCPKANPTPTPCTCDEKPIGTKRCKGENSSYREICEEVVNKCKWGYFPACPTGLICQGDGDCVAPPGPEPTPCKCKIYTTEYDIGSLVCRNNGTLGYIDICKDTTCPNWDLKEFCRLGPCILSPEPHCPEP